LGLNILENWHFAIAGFSGFHSLGRAFQAYDEGSIPFTRSNLFNDLEEAPRAAEMTG
jgi:hypothetical protein